jgi:hypothetical protein
MVGVNPDKNFTRLSPSTEPFHAWLPAFPSIRHPHFRQIPDAAGRNKIADPQIACRQRYNLHVWLTPSSPRNRYP